MQDRGDPAVVAFLDTITRNIRQERQTEKDVYDAYQSLSKCVLNFCQYICFLTLHIFDRTVIYSFEFIEIYITIYFM